MTVRILSALVLVPVALLIILQGGLAYLLMLLAVGTLVHREWQTVTGAPGLFWSVPALAFGWAAAAALQTGDPEWAGILTALGVGSAVAMALLRGRSAGWAAAGAAYFILPTLALVHLRLDGYESVVWLFVVVWATDTGAYLVGSQVGGAKLWRRVSPNKTWSGAVGGVAFGAITGLAVAAILDDADLYGALLAGAAISIVAQAGDLAESAWKRHFKVKDSGGMIPGHGGVMDRMDGLIAAAVVLALMNRLDGVSI